MPTILQKYSTSAFSLPFLYRSRYHNFPQKNLSPQLSSFQNASGCQNRLKITKILKGVISQHLKKTPCILISHLEIALSKHIFRFFLCNMSYNSIWQVFKGEGKKVDFCATLLLDYPPLSF